MTDQEVSPPDAAAVDKLGAARQQIINQLSQVIVDSIKSLKSC